MARYFSLVLPLLLVLGVCGCTRSGEIGLHPGDLAPEIDLPGLVAESYSLKSYTGKVVLVNFWASWCAPCIEEMPALEKLYQTYKDQGLMVLSVAVDDQREALDGFRRDLGITFPIALDEKGDVKNRYKITGYPETFLVDREQKLQLFPDPDNGSPVVRVVGPRRWDGPSAKRYIEQLLK